MAKTFDELLEEEFQKRFQALTPAEIMKGLSVDEILRCLSQEQIEDIVAVLRGKKKALAI